MLTEKDVIETRKREETLAQSFFRGIIDFLKWTTTLVTAAVLWVGNAITSAVGFPQFLMVLSLLALMGSLLVAVLGVNRVLQAWATEWSVAREDERFVLIKKMKALKPGSVTETQESEQIQRLTQAIEATKPFAEPRSFYTWAVWHIILLMVGLLLYSLGQVASHLL